MADASNNANSATEVSAESTGGDAGRLTRFMRWSKASKLRMAIVSVTFLSLFGGTFATWSYLAHLAVEENDKYSLARALEAVDQQDYERAKDIVGEMQRTGVDPSEFGGALYVLGVVKAAQADTEWSKDRKRAMHLVAARYLQKARELGVPERLKSVAMFMTGRSLIEANQAETGIDVLLSSIDDPSLPKTRMHELLAEAYQAKAEPNLLAALKHNQAVLDDPQLATNRRNAATLKQADLLGRMGRLKEAGEYLELVGDDQEQQAHRNIIAGRIAIEQASRMPEDSEARKALAGEARQYLQEAKRLDPLNSKRNRRAMYWIGTSFVIEGNKEAALQRFAKLNKLYGDTMESLTAMLDRADLSLSMEKVPEALAGYREVLSTVGNPNTYRNDLLPLSELRKRLRLAFNKLLANQHFDEVMALLDSLQPVMLLTDVTELRAQAHEKWATAEFELAKQDKPWKSEKHFSKGRYHHRAAATAYELLAKLRYATRRYTDHIWNAAENYFAGQNYSHAKRMYQKYLYHEAKEKQAMTLLRLGQAHLALEENREAIDTLTECIESYPRDATVYQARIDCAHAHLELAQGDQAESLLLANLRGSNLDPKAKEWLDSLFLLGEHLHSSGRFQEAIEQLDEAVLRYERLDKTSQSHSDAEQAMLARYTIARSFHNAAEKPARLARDAKTESERQKNRKLRDKNLNEALANYLQVQRMLTLQGHVDSNELDRLLLRNCYMMQGSVLFELKRYEEARKAYANISTLYQNEPFVLESFIHIANCYRRLNKPVKAKGTIEQAKLVLNRFPIETDFKLSTNFSRQSWELLLNEMSGW